MRRSKSSNIKTNKNTKHTTVMRALCAWFSSDDEKETECARGRERERKRERDAKTAALSFFLSHLFCLWRCVCLAVIFPPFHRGFCLTKNSISVLHVLWKYWWCWCDCRSTIGNSSMQFDYIFDGKRRSKWHKRNQHSSWKCVLSKIDSAFLWDSSHSQSSFRRLRGRSILFLKF